jgi:NAD(P)-dependent dehydrogenase (short-subunit alcohol dehydrogenase family)
MPFPQPLRAVVTGAGSGLGRALAVELAQRGASLIISDINPSSAEETAELVRQQQARAEAIVCDVTDRNAVFGLVEETEKRLGGIDLIANNAGVAIGGPFDEISIEDWRWAVDINLWGVIYGCQAAVPKMLAQGHGYILNVASAAGLIGAIRGATTKKEDARVIRWMERSKVQAPGVAKSAIDSVRDGKLYVQPMREGRMAWRLKRANPQRFYDSLSRAHQQFLRGRRTP